MIKEYLYRFKTKEEFEKEFKDDWRFGGNLACFANSMDYLLGTVLEYDFPDNKSAITISSRNYRLYSTSKWIINKWMLTSNKPTVPNYKPRKITREI